MSRHSSVLSKKGKALVFLRVLRFSQSLSLVRKEGETNWLKRTQKLKKTKRRKGELADDLCTQCGKGRLKRVEGGFVLN